MPAFLTDPGIPAAEQRRSARFSLAHRTRGRVLAAHAPVSGNPQ
jgi:hypothetical protein